MPAKRGLKSARDALLFCYADDFIDDEEFVLLYDANWSRELYPYRNVERFNFDNLDNTQCLADFRFEKEHILRLTQALGITRKVICSQRSTCDGVEATCILLKRLAFPCRYSDMVSSFGRNPTEICLIFNRVLDIVYDAHHNRL